MKAFTQHGVTVDAAHVRRCIGMGGDKLLPEVVGGPDNRPLIIDEVGYSLAGRALRPGRRRSEARLAALLPSTRQGKKQTMNRFLGTLSAAALTALLVAAPAAAQEQSRFGVDASEWDSLTVPVAGVIIPVGGSGQLNGEFVTGERYGVQIALRTQVRFVGPILPVARAKQTGVYAATTGYSDGSGRATWNYDLHIDLRNAQGVAAGKTLGDYSLVLDSDISPSFFGCAFPCDLTPLLPSTVQLFQRSLNPKFGNPAFDSLAADSYYFTLTLTPKSFNGPPITARIRVDVSLP